MPITVSTERVQAIMSLDFGVVDGKQKVKNKAYYVQDQATNEAIYNSVEILAELQEYDLLKVGKRTNETLTNL